ncbi:hypothetical protein GCM10010211_37840 [Streptomyces albospinus]|uniref:Uncharacterized protein n=1 Tax=Streptomyces albospinus TaxID=285515 RepID=A0ABQ2V4L5_9ACTN|nr:hypothetical protein GCM10010211_37840 [Streptomyces albospinus]
MVAAGGQRLTAVKLHGERTPLEELGEPTSLAGIDPCSSWGLLAFLIAVQAVDVAGLIA